MNLILFTVQQTMCYHQTVHRKVNLGRRCLLEICARCSLVSWRTWTDPCASLLLTELHVNRSQVVYWEYRNTPKVRIEYRPSSPAPGCFTIERSATATRACRQSPSSIDCRFVGLISVLCQTSASQEPV